MQRRVGPFWRHGRTGWISTQPLSPGPRDYATVGELYDVLATSLEACVAAFGAAEVSVGDPTLQVEAGLSPLPGVVAVTDPANAQQAISTIVTQGEGAGGEQADSHVSRFCRLSEELATMLAADARFEPAWPAATNPVMNPPVHSASERAHISRPQVARWLDIGNAIHTTSLRCLLQGFGKKKRQAKATRLAASFALMRTLVPVGQGLAARPATDDPSGPHTGLTFTPLRTPAWLPQEGAAALAAERLGQLRERALELPPNLVTGETAATWQGVIDLLAAQHAALLALPGLAAVPSSARAQVANAEATSASIAALRTRPMLKLRSKWRSRSSGAAISRCCSRPGVAFTPDIACSMHRGSSRPTPPAPG